MVSGLVLIRLGVGKEKDALDKLHRIKGVADITGVFGSWDAVAKIEGEDLKSLATLVIDKIRETPGVTNTETLIEVRI